MRRIAAGAWMVLWSITGMAPQQVTIDRILERVYGQVVTQSDVWQVLTLKLTEPPATTFAAAQRDLENRILLLREALRVPTLPPDDTVVALHRARWRQTLAVDDEALASLVERAGMTASALTVWFRDSARIAAYLDQRFNNVPEADRPAAQASWLRQLRDRAGLPSIP